MRCRGRRGEPCSWKGAGNMLKLPPQFERLLKATTTHSRQLKEVERAGGRHHVTVCRPSGVLQSRRRVIQRGCEKELFVDTRAATAKWVVQHNSCRVKRSFSSGRCKVWLYQQVRGTTFRDLSPPGLLLVPVSYTATPAVETNGRVLDPIEDKERFLNALLASSSSSSSSSNNNNNNNNNNAPLMVPNDTNGALISNADREVEARACNRKEAAGETKKVSSGKQKWRLCMQMSRISPEMHQKRVDLSNSDNLRQLEEKILLLESVDVDTLKVLALYPAIASVTVQKLKSVIDYLESCGLRRKDLGRILSMTPQILGLSVECDLRPAVRFLLREVGLPKTDLRKVINRCPRLLVASVDSQMRPTMHFLEGLGFNRMVSLVSNNATLLTFGIQSKLLPKLEFLQTLGMSREEAVTLVLRFPAIFNYGVEQNLRPKYDYLVNVMGRDVEHLKAFPQYFGYSLDSRIRPRHEFLRQRNMQVSLSKFLKVTDDEFHRRFKGALVRDVGEARKLAAGMGCRVDESGEKPTLAAIIDSQVDESGEKPKFAAGLGSQVDEFGEKPKCAAVTGSEVDEPGEKLKLVTVIGSQVNEFGKKPNLAAVIGSQAEESGEKPTFAAAIGSQVDQSGEKPMFAAVLGSLVNEAGEKTELAAVVGSQVDEAGEKPRLAAVKKSEAASHRRIPVHIALTPLCFSRISAMKEDGVQLTGARVISENEHHV